MPVRLSRRHGEGRGHGDEEGALLGQRAIKLREAHIVADGETDGAERRVGNHGLIAAGHGIGFAVSFAASQFDIEQVDLAVAGGNRPFGRNQEAAIGGLGVADLDGDAADQQPDIQLPRQRGEHRQCRIVGLVMTRRQLGAGIGRHQRGVLGRGDEDGPLGGCVAHQHDGLGNILRYVVAGAQLNAGRPEGCHLISGDPRSWPYRRERRLHPCHRPARRKRQRRRPLRCQPSAAPRPGGRYQSADWP